jgi:superfamily II DNA helicase RecQ
MKDQTDKLEELGLDAWTINSAPRRARQRAAEDAVEAATASSSM